MLFLAEYVNIDENRSHNDRLSAICAESINCVDHVAASLGPLGRDMKSPKGFAAPVVFFLTLPIAVLCQMLIGVSAETVVHWGFGLGSALLSLAVFDFRTPSWVAWMGSVSTGALAAVFLLQGVSELIGNRSLSYLAFQVFGQRLEARFIYVLVYCDAVH